MRHTALPPQVEAAVAALSPDAHPMGVLLTGLSALSTCHPEANPAISGQNVYKSREVQDKQIVRLLGKVPSLAALAYHKSTGRRPAPPNQRLGYTENFLYMLDGFNSGNQYRPHPKLVRALVRTLLVLFLVVGWGQALSCTPGGERVRGTQHACR